MTPKYYAKTHCLYILEFRFWPTYKLSIKWIDTKL